MQAVVPPVKEVSRGQEYGEFTSPCLTSPLLETPNAFPSFVVCSVPPTEECRYTPPVVHYDEHLTGLLKTYTNGIFSEYVNYISLSDGSNVPIINCYNSADRFAIGARTELLHNRYDIGPLLLTLLDRSPLWIMTPSEIEYYTVSEAEQYHPRQTKDSIDARYCERSSGLFPDWISEESLDVPSGLPYNLSVLINECISKLGRDFEHVHDYDDYSIASWPIATCSWYGFEAYQSKFTNRLLQDQQFKTGLPPNRRAEYLPDTDMAQATDPTWMALDRMIEEVQNHTNTTCVKQHHEPTEIEDDLHYFGAFAQLLNYLSHARLEN